MRVRHRRRSRSVPTPPQRDHDALDELVAIVPEQATSNCTLFGVGVILIAAISMLCAGCATTKEIASKAADGVEEAVGGPSEDPGLRRTVIIDPGYQPLSRALESAEAVADDSAGAGHRLAVRIVDSGNASSLRDVDLSSANGGDLRRQSRNGPGRREEAEHNARAVTAAIRDELDDFSYTGSGTDLFGAIERSASGRPAPDQVVLITGGGVHQTADLNLVADYDRVAQLVKAIPPLVAPDTELVIVGVADFTGSETTPTIEFTDAVTHLWESACATWQVRDCVLASGTDVLETLGG